MNEFNKINKLNNENDIKVIINHEIINDTEIFNKENDYLMYVLINKDLEMSLGKIVSQTSHAISKIIRILENMNHPNPHPHYYKTWLSNYEPKIILKAKDEELLYCIDNFHDINKDIWCSYQLQLSKTKNDPFSITAVVFAPMKKKETPEFIKKLKRL